MYGIHGIDDDPKLHPYANPENSCNTCSSNTGVRRRRQRVRHGRHERQALRGRVHRRQRLPDRLSVQEGRVGVDEHDLRLVLRARDAQLRVARGRNAPNPIAAGRRVLLGAVERSLMAGNPITSVSPMISKTKLLAVGAHTRAVTAGGRVRVRIRHRVDRWATTENTNVQIRLGQGQRRPTRTRTAPRTSSKRVNEISTKVTRSSRIAVTDQDDKTQIVTGFFDKNKNGAVDEGERSSRSSASRPATGTAQYQTHGLWPVRRLTTRRSSASCPA